MFKVLDEVCEPKRATKYSAYVDLFAREDVVIRAGEPKIVPLGVKIDIVKFQDIMEMNSNELKEFMQSHYLEVALRSSMALKGLIIANGTGKVDLDYQNEIGIILHNPLSTAKKTHFHKENYALLDDSCMEIKKGDKVAQCTLVPHAGYLLEYESDVARTGGYGSTGK